MAEPKKRGRPRIEINQKYFENLCKLQCTEKYGDIFSAVYKKHAEAGKISLRRNQFNLSKTNATMAIWLGKQYLGQRDVQVIDATVKDDTPKVDLSQLSRQEILELTQNLYKNEQK